MMFYRVIAVDDSPIIIKMLEVMLANRYLFRGFTKSDRAVEYLRTKGADLLILDIDMPDIDGLEVLEKIREDFGQKMPIIMLTSNNDKKYVLECFTRGANDYAIKPIDEEQFLEKLEKLLNIK